LPTYHGASAIARSVFDWNLWMMLIVVGFAHPQIFKIRNKDNNNNNNNNVMCYLVTRQ
jgi:hypothetical protein